MLTRIAGILLLPVLAVAGIGPVALPLAFEPNRGQADASSLYLARRPGYAMHFEKSAISLTRGAAAVRMNLEKAQAKVRVHGYAPQAGKANYLVGGRNRWLTGIPLYGGVEYQEVYPGVNLLFYGKDGQLEYDFCLAPGAEVAAIHFSFEGVEEMRIEDGDLVLKTALGELRHKRPRVYQQRNGVRAEVAGRFVMRGSREAGFEVAAYDARQALVIDPVLAYGTFVGGSSNDAAWAVAADSSGSAYIAGETWSTNFPRTLTAPKSTGSQDAFLVKLNAAGTAIVYATYFGGSGRESARGLALDSAGNAYLTGFTNSPDFPTTAGAYRRTPAGQEDAFAVKINSSGTALVYATLLGGSGCDFANAIAVDSAGNAYITGYTSSLAFPLTSGVLQTAFGGGAYDSFVAKLNAGGAGLIYSTYLGGGGSDIANGIAVDAQGFAYVAGSTNSTNFPVRNALRSAAGGQGDAFVAKLNPSADGLAYGTYLGGRLPDYATAIAIDTAGDAYITGSTLSSDFPVTLGALQAANHGDYDAFVSKLNPSGSALLYSTYLGGEGTEEGDGIAVDSSGRAYLAGFTSSLQFPVQAPVQSASHGGREAFAAAVSVDGASLWWSTYLGGGGDERTTGVALDAAGGVYIAGYTLSPDFPVTAGAYRTSYAGGEGFLIKLTAAQAQPPANVSVTPSSGSGTSQTFAFTGSSGSGYGNISSVQVLFNRSVTSAGACSFNYVAANNTVYLNTDSGAAWVGNGVLGTSGTIENSQCRLSLGGSSAAGVGNNLTVSLAVTFKSGLQGQQNAYMAVGDNAGLASSWQLMGTWTVTAASPLPANVSVTPSSGTGTTQTFAFTASSPGGYRNIAYVQIIIGPTLNAAGTCFLTYIAASNTIFLNTDSGTASAGSGVLGASGPIENSQCRITPGASSAAGSSNDLVVNLAIMFKSGLHGLQNTYMVVVDNTGLSSTWQQMGAWTVSVVSQLPTNVSVVPSSGSGTTQIFAFTGSSGSGYRNIAYAQIIIGAALTGVGSCFLTYIPESNALYLNTDNGTASAGNGVLGVAGTLENSQCRLNLGASSATGSSNNLAISLAVTFKNGLSGQLNTYMVVVDKAGLASAWQKMGTWTVSAPSQPSANVGRSVSMMAAKDYRGPVRLSGIGFQGKSLRNGRVHQRMEIVGVISPNNLLFVRGRQA